MRARGGDEVIVGVGLGGVGVCEEVMDQFSRLLASCLFRPTCAMLNVEGASAGVDGSLRRVESALVVRSVGVGVCGECCVVVVVV